MAPITITVALCTHNRAAYLRKALASLAQQTAGGFDILVVDNASNDDTPAVVRAMQRELPRLRSVHEPRLGLSHARNRALHETSTRYIAYLDDDAVAGPGWVEALLNVFATVRPRPVVVGGPVHPIWLAPRPAWLGDRIRGCLTIIDWGGERRFIDGRRQFIVGANMAFEREAVLACNGFDPELGRIGDRLMSGEEMVLQRQLIARGGRICYEPAAAVQHHVHPDRLDKRWFYERFYYEGVSQAVSETRSRSLGRLPRYGVALRKLASGLRRGRWHQALIGSDERTRLASRLEALRTLTVVVTLLQMPEAMAQRAPLAPRPRDLS